MFKESNKEIKMVHKKLMAARIMLQNAPLKKSGHNKFAGYSYFELGDFIPTINQIFNEVGLCGVVSYDTEIASLTITDTDDGTNIIITSPMADANDTIPEDEQNYLRELAMELIALCDKEEPKSAWVKLEAENLDSEQKVALWTLLPSKVRSALKNAKG